MKEQEEARMILFTHSYFYKLDAKQWRFKQPYPPLATLLAAAVMRGEGHAVALVDTNLQDDPRVIVPALKTHAPRYVVIYDDGFNYLTKMCLTVMRDAAFVMAAASKAQGCTVIVSSSDATDHYEKYFEHGVDYVVRGEGEETLKELIATLEANGNTALVQGIAFRANQQTVVTPPRPVLRDLDALPLPAWDLVDMEAYRAIWVKHHGYFSLNVATTRGCPFKCNWCAKPIYGNRYTSRSPAHVVQEIEFLLTHYRPDRFWMCDDIFGLKPGWIAEFNTQVKVKKLVFTYKIQSRVDLLDHEVVNALAESGATSVWVGAESGSQKILDAMDKGTTVAQIYEATQRLKTKGIGVGFFLQFGYLGETEHDIDATLQMVLELMPDEVGISVSYPLPGTKFYENVKDQLREKQNWSDSDDLAMMFNSTFNHAYYKALHRYVHYVYRKQKGYASLKKLMQSPLRLTRKDLKQSLGTFYFGARATLLNKRLRTLIKT
ncbi:B12-binding domain-containing radical SAM protein [Chryseolinea lacunae]|uniref:B12-binding domain-containing radical SAM protein n=1 Tax=Chryseolinea lacunae TaxID=2801331 RepID=A0ABS1KS70_9BACT|nr:radical SAM protein [Chryseolinea lacunae]MBL0742271.1 B12-binding domain-containing radical SAM protein [Chryseolinea lacunae]